MNYQIRCRRTGSLFSASLPVRRRLVPTLLCNLARGHGLSALRFGTAPILTYAGAMSGRRAFMGRGLHPTSVISLRLQMSCGSSRWTDDRKRDQAWHQNKAIEPIGPISPSCLSPNQWRLPGHSSPRLADARHHWHSIPSHGPVCGPVLQQPWTEEALHCLARVPNMPSPRRGGDSVMPW